MIEIHSFLFNCHTVQLVHAELMYNLLLQFLITKLTLVTYIEMCVTE